jgi:hypothetical protein
MLKDQTSISTNNSGLRNLQLKRIFKWLRRDPPQQTIASEADQGDVGVRPDQTTDGEHSDDSSLSCSWADQADSSIFDTGSLNIEKSEDKNAVSHETPDLEGDLLCGAEQDTGVDPYNTGRFDTKNK